MNKIPVLSFFSGGGFMDMGFEQAGFEIVWTNEYDKDFVKLHAAGITSWRKSQGNGIKAEIFNTKSITEVSSKEISEEAFPQGKPESFGVIGGPPCQDFSINGKLRGFEGERGKLTTIFYDRILELRPSFFVMENVTGLTKGKRHKDHFEKLIERVREAYYIDSNELNAINFGVPQSRERVFFIGIKKSSIRDDNMVKFTLPKWFRWPIFKKYADSLKKYKWPQSSEFGMNLQKPDDVPIELCVESCLVAEDQATVVPNALEVCQFKRDSSALLLIKEGETNRPSFKRLHRFRYSPTACYGNNEVHMHPYLNRRLSVREALRVQGVPDSYVLPPELPLSKKFKMIGNGVPVPLARAVATSLAEFLHDHNICVG